MAKVSIKPIPRVYNFEIGSYSFRCLVEWKNELGVHPIDILIVDLQECLDQLEQMPRFKVEEPYRLPPLSPDYPQS